MEERGEAVGLLPVGTEFVTFLTRRLGMVTAQMSDATLVCFGSQPPQEIHPGVRVKRLEVTK